MCGRIYETYTNDELSVRYVRGRPPAGIPQLAPVYNLCPTMTSPVLRLMDGEFRFDLMHWQLIPPYEPTFKTKLSTINAKSETVFQSALFKDLLVRRRCIIPISGFFEWKREGSTKRPFRIFLQDEPIMSVAGLWDVWHPGSKDMRCSFTILTTAANSFMSAIHDRMPVVLGRNDEQNWLDPEVHEQADLRKILTPCPSSWLASVEVSSLVNSAANNSSELLDPVGLRPAKVAPRLLFD